MFNQTGAISVVVFLLSSLTSIGFILEDRKIGAITEILRGCVVIFLVRSLLTPGGVPETETSTQWWKQILLGAYGLSVFVWSIHLLVSTFSPAIKDKSAVRKNAWLKQQKNVHKNGMGNRLPNKKLK